MQPIGVDSTGPLRPGEAETTARCIAMHDAMSVSVSISMSMVEDIL